MGIFDELKAISAGRVVFINLWSRRAVRVWTHNFLLAVSGDENTSLMQGA
jgi:hypothetical protein